jgi:predicted phosphodiesterase
MKLWVLSDLHLEASCWDPPSGVEADVVVLAGDIHQGRRGIDWAQRAFKGREVVYVAGNHEGYGQYWLPLMEELRSVAKPPVHFLECSQVVIGGVRFLGATLWTDCYLWGDRAAVLAVQRYLNDFRCIRMDRESDLRLEPVEMIRWHERALDWLHQALEVPFDGPTVVVTHHAPHPNSVRPYDPMQNQPISGYFASDLSWLIEWHQPALWIHGHSHASLDYQVGRTRVLANPAGYAYIDRPRENCNFKPNLVVEV